MGQAPNLTYSDPIQLTEAVSTPLNESKGNRSHTVVSAEIQRFEDHIDTDAIIPGEFCHLTDLEELGERCFHYVSPGFKDRVMSGRSILVAGEGWGSGSSREHAVWALKGAGVSLIIAKSFAFIHKRNLVNEALPYLQVTDDEFYTTIDALNIDDGVELSADLVSGELKVNGRSFFAEPPSDMVRRLGELGGIVPAIKQHGGDVFSKLTAPQSNP